MIDAPPKIWTPPKPAIIRMTDARRDFRKGSFMPGFRIPPASLKSIALQSSAESDAATITAPSDIIAGDLLFLHDAPGGTMPIFVPAGFTKISANTFGNANDVTSFKLADGSEAGATITGVNGTLANRKLLAVLRANARLRSANMQGATSSGFTDANPAPVTITSGSGSVPMIVLASYRSSGAVNPRSFQVGGIEAKDGELGNAATTIYLAWKLLLSAADAVLDMADNDSNNLMHGCYLEVAV